MRIVLNIVVLQILLLFFTSIISAQEIFDAVRNGDLPKIKELVETDPQLVHVKNANQSTPLHVAASLNKIQILIYLIEKGALINEKNVSGRTALHYAAEADYVEIAKILVDKGADITIQNSYSQTAMMIAGIHVAKLLVSKGVDINFETTNGNALRIALAYGKEDVVDYLLDCGARIPTIDSSRYNTMLFDALEGGNLKYFEKCLEQGLNPLFETETKSNLLHQAAAGISLEIIQKLLDLGVPPDKTNIYGLTPLHIAAMKSNKAVIELFVKMGLDKNARTIDGRSPYNLAVEAKKNDIIDYLKEIGADLSEQKYPVLKGAYLGQPKPGKKGEPFAPGIVAVFNNFHSSIVFSPNGMEAYWGLMGMQGIMGVKVENGKWILPFMDPLLSECDVPIISPDGQQFLFLKRIQVQGKPISEQIAVRKQIANNWSEPMLLSDTVNSIQGMHWQISVDKKGNLYFGARQNNATTSRIYYSEFKNEAYSQPIMIDELKNINAHSPFISPDGSYMIFTSDGLKIIFKTKNGRWSSARSLDEITGPNVQCSFVSYDGKYMFYLHYVGDRYIPYWVDASFIEEMRKNI